MTFQKLRDCLKNEVIINSSNVVETLEIKICNRDDIGNFIKSSFTVVLRI